MRQARFIKVFVLWLFIAIGSVGAITLVGCGGKGERITLQGSGS